MRSSRVVSDPARRRATAYIPDQMTTSRVERRPRPIPFGADQSDLATGRPAYDDGDWLVLRPLVPAEEIALHAQRIEPASPDRAADVVTALDLKLTGRGDVWHVANRHAVSASFLRALSAFSTDTVAWTEVDHATPLDVHRSRLFWIVPEPGQATLATGSATPLLPSGEAGRIPGSYAGLPGRPLSVDVTDAESVPLSFTRWFRGSSAYPLRLADRRLSLVLDAHRGGRGRPGDASRRAPRPAQDVRGLAHRSAAGPGLRCAAPVATHESVVLGMK